MGDVALTEIEPSLQRELEAAVAQSASAHSRITAVEADQASIVDTLEVVATRVEQLLASAPGLNGRSAPHSGPKLGADDQLAEWVNDWLIPTFALHILLDGWERHAGFRSEVAALHLAHQQMVQPSAHGFDPIVWHSHLASMIDRLERLKHRTHADTANNERLSDLLRPSARQPAPRTLP